jgi:hypothetical protein
MPTTSQYIQTGLNLLHTQTGSFAAVYRQVLEESVPATTLTPAQLQQQNVRLEQRRMELEAQLIPYNERLRTNIERLWAFRQPTQQERKEWNRINQQIGRLKDELHGIEDRQDTLLYQEIRSLERLQARRGLYRGERARLFAIRTQYEAALKRAVAGVFRRWKELDDMQSDIRGPAYYQSPEYSQRRRLGVDAGPARFDLFAISGGAVATTHGFGARDTAGLLQPGTLTPNSRSTSTGIGLRGSVDASRWLNLDGDQTLLANGFVSYSRVDSKSETPADLIVANLTNSGSARADNVTIGGDARYDFMGMYLQGAGAYNFAKQDISNTIDGSRGSFDSQSYNVDLRMGKAFLLDSGIFGPMIHPGRFTKARPPAGGYIIALDLSGHVGHTNLRTDAFTDSTGFAYGTSQTRYETVGGRAELFAVVLRENVLWVPFVAMKVDQRFDFSSSANFPVQPDLPNGNIVYYSPANTFWGPELGLTIATPGWWNVQARGFYLASSDTDVAGGSLSARIPFRP